MMTCCTIHLLYVCIEIIIIADNFEMGITAANVNAVVIINY